jgi:hypothetical protein
MNYFILYDKLTKKQELMAILKLKIKKDGKCL